MQQKSFRSTDVGLLAKYLQQRVGQQSSDSQLFYDPKNPDSFALHREAQPPILTSHLPVYFVMKG